MKYLVVTGGTLSGLGKGTTISSIGVVLKSMGLRLTAVKIDPYLNIDAGTMSPYEHGEVYVLEDGGEVDLDLGNYERFLGVTLSRDHNITTGKIYDRVIRYEREGKYLGKTVQLVPHITNCVQNWLQYISHVAVDGLDGTPDVCLLEIGGTVGDIESEIYLEALQQFSGSVGWDNLCVCHVSFVPVMGTVGEQKTKPTQKSIRDLRMTGIKPDFIFCRSEESVGEQARQKIALFGQVAPEHVISVHDVSNIYHVPQMISDQNFGELVIKRLKLQPRLNDPVYLPLDACPAIPGRIQSRSAAVGPALSEWAPGKTVLDIFGTLAARVDASNNAVTIGIVGKYTGLMDSYLSVIKALRHAAIEAAVSLEITFIDSSSLEDPADTEAYESAWGKLKKVNGVLCPGGFGDRGIVGKSLSARHCRHSKVPYLGICLGLQTAVIDMCRELGYDDAHSEEMDPESKNKVVIFMPEIDPNKMGGTMRLGCRDTTVKDQNSLVAKLYDHAPVIRERHRHRYEVNPEYVPAMEKAGLKFTGADGVRMEIAEMEDHPFFLCTQFHPEFTSRPMRPNPCFLGFMLASAGLLEKRFQDNDDNLYPGSAFLQCLGKM